MLDTSAVTASLALVAHKTHAGTCVSKSMPEMLLQSVSASSEHMPNTCKTLATHKMAYACPNLAGAISFSNVTCAGAWQMPACTSWLRFFSSLLPQAILCRGPNPFAMGITGAVGTSQMVNRNAKAVIAGTSQIALSLTAT